MILLSSLMNSVSEPWCFLGQRNYPFFVCWHSYTDTSVSCVQKSNHYYTLATGRCIIKVFTPAQTTRDWLYTILQPTEGYACVYVCTRVHLRMCVCVLPQWWVPSHVVCIKMLLCVMRLQKVVMPTEITIPCCQPLSFIVGWLPMLCMHVRMCTQAPRHALNVPA